MRTRSLFLIVVATAAVAVVAYPATDYWTPAVVAYPAADYWTPAVVAYPAADYWTPIGDIDDPHIQELGNWSVGEHIRQTHIDGGLQFRKVTSGEEEDEAGGIRYHLIIDVVSAEGKLGRYDVELREDVRALTRGLISFVLAN